MSYAVPRPFENSYWVIPGKLLAGATPGIANTEATHSRLRSLKEYGITSIINLTEADEKDHNGNLFYNYEVSPAAGQLSIYRFPIRDMDIPSPVNMARILAQIDREINAGRTAYVHCWGGLGRTGTVVGCYLLQKKMVEVEMVFDRIRELKSASPVLAKLESPQTIAQREFVEGWV